jgi:hypothetical protein
MCEVCDASVSKYIFFALRISQTSGQSRDECESQSSRQAASGFPRSSLFLSISLINDVSMISLSISRVMYPDGQA